jgi:hypothetical protein
MSVNVGAANVTLELNFERFNQQFEAVRRKLESIKTTQANIVARLDPSIQNQMQDISRGLNTAVTAALAGLGSISASVVPALSTIGTVISSSVIPQLKTMENAFVELGREEVLDGIVKGLKSGELEISNTTKALEAFKKEFDFIQEKAKRTKFGLDDIGKLQQRLNNQIKEQIDLKLNSLKIEEQVKKNLRLKNKIMEEYGIKVKKATDATNKLSNSTVSGANKSIGAIGSMKSMFKKLLAPILAAISVIKLFRAVSKGIADNIREVKAFAQLNATLQKTGKVIGITTKEAKKFASELEKTTTIPVENIARAMALFSTNTTLTESNLKKATEAAADLSVAMGTDITSAARLLNRALAEPEKGINQLAIAGVIFSEENKKVIKSLVETGQIAKAQAVIFKQLQTSGITGQAAGNVTQIDNLKRAWGDLGKNVGEFITKILGLPQTVDGLARLFDSLSARIRIALDSKIVRGFGIAIQLVAGTITTAIKLIMRGFEAVLTVISGLGVALFELGRLNARGAREAFRVMGSELNRNYRGMQRDMDRFILGLQDQWENGLKGFDAKGATAIDLDVEDNIDEITESVEELGKEIERTSQILSGASSIWENFASNIKKRFDELGNKIEVPVIGEIELDNNDIRKATAQLGAVDVNLSGKGNIGSGIVNAINTMKDLLHRDLQTINTSVNNLSLVGIV